MLTAKHTAGSIICFETLRIQTVRCHYCTCYNNFLFKIPDRFICPYCGNEQQISFNQNNSEN